MERDSSLGAVATKFLASLPPKEREIVQPEVFRFARWYGWGRSLTEITIPELSNYAEQVAASTAEPLKKIEPVKAFLNYARKEGFIKTNLAIHLRVRKGPSRSTLSPRQLPSATISLTPEGYAQLEAELTALKQERPRIAEELRRAAADKDLSENAPFEAAREYQGQVEARIRALEAILKVATVVEEKSSVSKADVGSNVVLKDLATGEEMRYTLVNPSEANPTAGKISIASPIGKAVVGREPGETIEVSVPAGILRYRIEHIE